MARGGFTLVELLVVVALLAVAAAIVGTRVTVPARVPEPPLVQLLRAEREAAIMAGGEGEVRRRVADGGVRLVGKLSGRSLPLADGARIVRHGVEFADYLPVHVVALFYPDGTARADRLRLVGARGEVRLEVVVDPFTGRVSRTE
jgi:prepilin-type N-terminal cleavage/methylation domain-containing protein